MALIFVGVYVAGLVVPQFTSNTFLIPAHVAALAGLTATLSLAAYFFTPKKQLSLLTFGLYLLLLITTGALLAHDGFTSSPFIGLGMAILVFAGLFGPTGLGVAAVLVNGQLAYDFIINGHAITSTQQLLVLGLAYEVPLLASWVIWHTKGARESEQSKAYNALAKELNQVANKSEIVINAIGDGVIAVDGRGIVELINPAAQKILGWGKQDALQLDYRSLFKLEDGTGTAIPDMQHPVQQTLKDGQSILRNDLQLETKSKKKIYVSLLTSSAGQGGGAIIIFRDISKEKTEERQQAEFISTASHEMRTPVASIEGYLGLALNPSTAAIDDKARMYLTKAHEAAQHLGRLFQDLLDISRAEDGRLVSNPKILDVVAFMQDLITNFETRAKDKGVILLFKPIRESNSARQLSPVFYANVDNDQLREVLSNLIDNAIKYTNQGDVTINVTGDNEHVKVSISDTGIGIPPEDIPHLFQKFYRVDNSDTREIGGTGLGLYLCRRFVEQMGGRIWVESEYHKGSTFFVELPRVSHEDATRQIEQAGSQDTAKADKAIVASIESFIDKSAPDPSAAPPVAAPVAPPVTAPAKPAPTTNSRSTISIPRRTR